MQVHVYTCEQSMQVNETLKQKILFTILYYTIISYFIYIFPSETGFSRLTAESGIILVLLCWLEVSLIVIAIECCRNVGQSTGRTYQATQDPTASQPAAPAAPVAGVDRRGWGGLPTSHARRFLLLSYA